MVTNNITYLVQYDYINYTNMGWITNKNGNALGAIFIGATSIYLSGFNFPSNESFINAGMLSSGIVIGSFLPDLDAEYIYFNSRVPIIPDIYKSIQNLSRNNSTMFKFFKHRGILMHSLWTLVLVLIINIIVVYKFNQFQNGTFLGDLKIQLIFTGLYLGIMGHLILDMVTRTGLKHVFYPLNIVITKYTIIKAIRTLNKFIKKSLKTLFKKIFNKIK